MVANMPRSSRIEGRRSCTIRRTSSIVFWVIGTTASRLAKSDKSGRSLSSRSVFSTLNLIALRLCPIPSWSWKAAMLQRILEVNIPPQQWTPRQQVARVPSPGRRPPQEDHPAAERRLGEPLSKARPVPKTLANAPSCARARSSRRCLE